jgi:SNF2 family DNA or RNA helicase
MIHNPTISTSPSVSTTRKRPVVKQQSPNHNTPSIRSGQVQTQNHHSVVGVRPLWKSFTYFHHQIQGINWMLQKETVGTLVPNKDSSMEVLIRGGLQCDDMGLGKTIQITSVLVNNPLPLTLLVLPLAMMDTWIQICQKSGLLVYTLDHHNNEQPWKLLNHNSPIPSYFMKLRPSIYITNYEKLYICPSLFQKPWNRIVLDEAHKIRNGDGQLAFYLRKLKADIRWAVTGTPLVNSLKDVVSLFAFIGIPYSPLWRWEQRYQTILPQILLHRSLSSLRDVIPNPPPIPLVHHLSLDFTTQQEEDFYYGVQGATESMAKKYSSDQLSSKDAFKLLLRLRQISVHPQVYINAKRREDDSYERPDWLDPSTKLSAIRDIILNDDFPNTISQNSKISEILSTFNPKPKPKSKSKSKSKSDSDSDSDDDKSDDDKSDEEFEPEIDWEELNTVLQEDSKTQNQDNGLEHKYIIFCQFYDEMILLKEYLVASDLIAEENVLMYYGEMSMEERTDVLNYSKETNEKMVLLIQLQAGGVGLNLQEYDRIIFMSPWWTSALMDQAIARAVRMGQTRRVHIYHLQLQAENYSTINIDLLVNAKAEEKREMLKKLFLIANTK